MHLAYRSSAMTDDCAQPPAQIRRGVVLATLAAVLFGMTAPVLKKASDGVGPLFASALLYVGAAMGAGLMAAFRRRGTAQSPMPLAAVARRVVTVAIVGAAIAPALLVVGLRKTDAATASLLLALEAPFTLALARLFLREHIGSRVVAAALLILVGGGGLVSASLGSATALAGTAFVAAAAFAWAVDNILSRQLADHDPVKIVVLKGILGALLSSVVGVIVGEAAPRWTAALAILPIGAVGYGISLQLYLRAQRVIGAGRTASVFGAAPFMGVLVAFAFGAPWPGIQFPVAGVLVGLGLWLHLSEPKADSVGRLSSPVSDGG